MRKKQIAALFLLTALACQILLPGKRAKAAIPAGRYEGYNICYKENRADIIYLQGRFYSPTNEKFEAHFLVYVSGKIFDYTHYNCSGYNHYYFYSPTFSANKSWSATGYTTK